MHRITDVITGNTGKAGDGAALHDEAAAVRGCNIVPEHNAVGPG